MVGSWCLRDLLDWPTTFEDQSLNVLIQLLFVEMAGKKGPPEPEWKNSIMLREGKHVPLPPIIAPTRSLRDILKIDLKTLKEERIKKGLMKENSE
eukprot:TCALIF_02735-PA protein Name:"Protein of unknown function" AED:0.41 eAED:0.41 QI:82/1/0.5/1/1/1/2/0/94